MDLVPGEQRMDNGLNPHPHPHPHSHSHPQMVFQEDNLNLQFQPQRRLTTDPVRKTRDLSSFAVDKIFAVDGGDRYFPGGGEGEFRRNIYGNQTVPPHHHHHQERPGNWNGEGSTESGGSEDDDDEEGEEDDDDDDDDEGDGEVEGLVGLDDGNGNKNNNNSSGSVHSSSEKIRCAKANLRKQQHSSLGSSRAGLAKGGNGVHSVANNVRGSTSEQHNQQGRVGNFDNAVTIAEPDMYYSQFLQGAEGSALGQKEIGGENGCGFGSGKDVMVSMESGESLRAILSDPITGTLMDDAMILPCGHSFGSGGMQHVIRTKACYTCSQSVSEDLVSPNLSLRYAIQAFRREEELQNRVSKRRRDRFEQDKSSSGELSMYLSKGKGVQFPFAVTDRVIIKGNKRTPLRFVGREAVVTTQCLNGWYVVKTLDNAESVKLQYRSLAKVSDSPSSNMANKSTPNWL